MSTPTAAGACTTVFTILNASVLRPYGMADPASVVRVHLLGRSPAGEDRCL